MKECGNCTVCCTLSVVSELNKKAWEKCVHCDKGCKIYDKRPQVCKDFECAYFQGGTNPELRPDKCGIMFVKQTDRIFSGILVPDVQVSDLAKGQIASFNKQGYSVILLKKGKEPYIKLADEHNTREIYEEYVNTLKNGNV